MKQIMNAILRVESIKNQRRRLYHIHMRKQMEAESDYKVTEFLGHMRLLVWKNHNE